MKNPRTQKKQPSATARTLPALMRPEFPDGICRLANAFYAAHGGAEHMNLADWRDAERELNQRIKNESSNI